MTQTPSALSSREHARHRTNGRFGNQFHAESGTVGDPHPNWAALNGEAVSNCPDLAAQWHPHMNGDATPDTMPLDARFMVWWLCSAGHEWRSSPRSLHHGRGCPRCAEQGVQTVKLHHVPESRAKTPWVGLSAELTAEWHPSLNGDLSPETVSRRGSLKVWWLCPEGHSWQGPVNRRITSRSCPTCARIAQRGSWNPISEALVAEWHPTLNDDLHPDMVRAGSDKRVWWMCWQGHEWQARVGDRSRGSRCPDCTAARVPLAPLLHAEWHPGLNGDLTPERVSAGSDTVIWWECQLGHEWQASVVSRADGLGCPSCEASWAGGHAVADSAA